MPYNILEGVRVVEVSLLAPDAVGGHLADLGAEVLKIEEPPAGDRVRSMGPLAVGGPDGQSVLHLHWNRGKKSVALNLKTAPGRQIFLDIVKKSQVVIEGLRAGALDRWGLGYQTLLEVNPKLVYCSVSGLGRTGPYSQMASHGVFFDAYAGFIPVEERPDGTVRPSLGAGPEAGFQASALWASMAILAALYHANVTGKGSLVEIAEAEVSAYWRWRHLDLELNRDKVHHRRTYGVRDGIEDSVRYTYYRTADAKVIFLMATEAKFWDNFLGAVDRRELKEKYPPQHEYDHQFNEEGLRRELAALFRTRTQEEWVDLLLKANVPGGPVNEADGILTDRHFAARNNVYSVDQPGIGRIRLTATPIKIEDQPFSAGPAPALGEHTGEVLRGILGLEDDWIAALVTEGVISLPGQP